MEFLKSKPISKVLRLKCITRQLRLSHVPFMRNFSKTVSVVAGHKEGLKLLVTGGSHAHKAIGIWMFSSAAWVFSMVILGGLMRLTRSGLSMTDWKFTGEFPPLTDEAWLQEFEKYQQSPEYKRFNC